MSNLKDRFGNPIPEWYQGYVKTLGDRDFKTVLSQNLLSTSSFLKSIPADKENFAYAEGKWTLKEVVLHVVDSERIFSSRALCFARKEKANLPGYDENEYAPNSDAVNRTLSSIIEEYEAVRKSSIELFKNFSETTLALTGNANNYSFSVDLCGVILVGHEMHHMKIIKERYL